MTPEQKENLEQVAEHIADSFWAALKRHFTERIAQLEAEWRTARHDLCLVCGAKEPCELKDDPSSPCTFEPTPMELLRKVRELAQEKQRLEAEVVRLKEEIDGWELGSRGFP